MKLYANEGFHQYNSVEVSADEAHQLIQGLPRPTVQLACETFWTAKTVDDKLAGIRRFLGEFFSTDHQPNLAAIYLDFHDAKAERTLGYIRAAAESCLPEIKAQRDIIGKELSRIDKLPNGTKKSLEPRVNELTKAHFTLTILGCIGQSKLAIKATPPSNMPKNPSLTAYLDGQFRAPDGSELTLPPRPVQAD